MAWLCLCWNGAVRSTRPPQGHREKQNKVTSRWSCGPHGSISCKQPAQAQPRHVQVQLQPKQNLIWEAEAEAEFEPREAHLQMKYQAVVHPSDQLSSTSSTLPWKLIWILFLICAVVVAVVEIEGLTDWQSPNLRHHSYPHGHGISYSSKALPFQQQTTATTTATNEN
ncbi:hypothetical protein V6N12_011788 [Hibiscus sabdariffa]|uniref:Uncharacterized protein n=1 Tax=Hibiscus sabdariffa TaxID=183260 RepID=A0ABR2BTF7_9ROSI